MSLSKILNALDNSWQRDDILLKIKSGLDSDEIVNEFLIKNKIELQELNSLLSIEDMVLLNQVEQVSNCEAKLIKKIKNLNYLQNNENNSQETNEGNNFFTNSVPANRISLIMINWSNKFVVIALLAISAIALSKQAWA